MKALVLGLLAPFLAVAQQTAPTLEELERRPEAVQDAQQAVREAARRHFCFG